MQKERVEELIDKRNKMLQFLTLIIAIYAAGLATIRWISGKAKKIKINYRLENTAFEGKIIHEAIIFQITNLSQKPIFIKYCYILNQNSERIHISPESFWTANREMSAEETSQLNPDRMLDIIYDRDEMLELGGRKFVLEDETGKKFFLDFDIKDQKPITYTVTVVKKK